MGTFNLFSAVAVSFMVATTPTLNAQEEEGTFTRRDTYQDWLLTCIAPEGREVCQLSQGIVNTETKQRLARLQIRRLPNGTDVMIVTLPLGVDLRKGAGIQVAKDQFINNLTYTMCLADGCRLQFPLNAEVIIAMRAAGEGRLVFGRPNVEQNTALPVSFTGFSAAFNAYVATH